MTRKYRKTIFEMEVSSDEEVAVRALRPGEPDHAGQPT